MILTLFSLPRVCKVPKAARYTHTQLLIIVFYPSIPNTCLLNRNVKR